MSGAAPEGVGEVVLEQRGAAAWITLNRPDRLNAFAGTMRERLHEAVTTASRAEGVRVIVVTGAGRAFSAGADVDAMERLLEAGDERGFARLVEAGMRVVMAIRAAPQLVVAAVNGVAAGAGASLAIACDLRFASEAARIGFTFNRIGLHPDWGATYTLPRLVGPGRAAELIYTGRILSAHEADELGVWDRLVPADRFGEELERFVAELAARPPLAMTAAKQSLARSHATDLPTMLDVEAAAQMACFRSADVREGIAAFRERRAPEFRGA